MKNWLLAAGAGLPAQKNCYRLATNIKLRICGKSFTNFKKCTDQINACSFIFLYYFLWDVPQNIHNTLHNTKRLPAIQLLITAIFITGLPIPGKKILPTAFPGH